MSVTNESIQQQAYSGILESDCSVISKGKYVLKEGRFLTLNLSSRSSFSKKNFYHANYTKLV